VSRIKNLMALYDRMQPLGFSRDEVDAMRRIESTLHRWAEGECGDGNDYASWSIERDETTGKPYRVMYPHQGKSYRNAIPDREKGALLRLARIMKGHPDFTAYHQTDPRGCALYIVPNDKLTGAVESCYTNGIAVCV
jgi:hypothetical protein